MFCVPSSGRPIWLQGAKSSGNNSELISWAWWQTQNYWKRESYFICFNDSHDHQCNSHNKQLIHRDFSHIRPTVVQHLGSTNIYLKKSICHFTFLAHKKPQHCKQQQTQYNKGCFMQYASAAHSHSCVCVAGLKYKECVSWLRFFFDLPMLMITKHHQ